MSVYLVGGAVRDELLGRPHAERDWVVVGSSPAELEAQGFRRVGRDFPVFLHPETREEYALARTERKSGPGHTGFECHAGPDVTLEQDLLRRDLTVNAMARDAAGTLVDPFGGAEDLAARVLRHVSEAFVEDPLRLFRVARFAAQLPGFSVAPETLALLARMAAQGALAELSAERVWAELDRALQAPAPAQFFLVLAAVNAWEPWFVEFRATAPRCPDASDPLMDGAQRFAALCWPLAATAARALCERLRTPKRQQRLALAVIRHGRTLAEWRSSTAQAVLAALVGIGAFAADREADDVLVVIEWCSGRSLDDLRAAIHAAAAIRAAHFSGRDLDGAALGDAIRSAREGLIAVRQRDGSQ